MKRRRMLGRYEKTMACLLIAIPALIVLRSILSQSNSGVLPHTVEEYSKPPGSDNSATSAFGGLDYSLPFPVYYINTDTSEGRRNRTELLFGDLWDLRRSPAVAGTDSETLLRLLGTDTFQWVTDYIERERFNDAKKAWNEVGCTLSHLTTIRKAYLENHEMVMIIEDDVSPALMPFWSSSIIDLIDEADKMSSSPPWSVIQAGWTFDRDWDIYVNNRPQPGRLLFQEQFQYGLFAYVINRRGMATLLDAHFSDRSLTGLLRVLDTGDAAEGYFDVLGSGIYVALPSLFTILEDESVIAGQDEERLNIHLHSNNVHMHETLRLMFERLAHQRTT